MRVDTVVLVHAGIGDNRMWDPIEPLLREGFEVRRHQLRGFGDTPLPRGGFSHVEDLEATLERPAALVGASFGGLVALEVAARRPDLVDALVLMDPPLPDHEWSEEMRQYFSDEERLLEAGDTDGAVALNVAFWVGDAEPSVREAVRAMTRRSCELQSAGTGEEEESGVVELGAVSAPLLVMVGAGDRADFHHIGRRLVDEVPGARMTVVQGAGHLPAMERPAETARLVLDFLAGAITR